MSEVLDQWNAYERLQAVETILPCNGSRGWAERLVDERPIRTPQRLFVLADAAWRGLNEVDRLEAFASHPRIGEKHAEAATAQSLAWSAGEQSLAGSGEASDEAVKTALAAGNRLYEERFGRVFLVCATGKSAAEMLAILQIRLGNTAEIELLEAAEQQRRITQLRLRKWLGLPAASCDTV